MKILKTVAKLLVPARFKKFGADVLLRLSRLEWALDALAEGPRYLADPGRGFNGQMGRKQIFQDLLSIGSFTAIVETGTATGNTTGYLAETSRLPVYSCDLDARFSAIARNKLADLKDIHLVVSASPAFLGGLAVAAEPPKTNTFFYLDAHWNDNLPLAEEIEIISAHWQEFAIMIDDFQVPGDSGYHYDDYGRGHALVLGLISGLLAKQGLKAFSPTLSAAHETGAKRGCVVLVRGPRIEEQIKGLASLKPAAVS